MSQITLDGPGAEPGAEQGAGRAGRRERNKQRTRDALIEAALELFEAKGYSRTAVHEITDAVDVSERTFFRYFASKEDLVLSFIRQEKDVFAAALAARPPEETPFTAIRNAYHESLLRVKGGVRVLRMIDSTPSLRVAHMRDIHEHGDEIVRVIADREGVDPETDLRPHVLAGVFGVLVYLSNQDLRSGDEQTVTTIAAAFDSFAEQVLSAISGHWDS